MYCGELHDPGDCRLRALTLLFAVGAALVLLAAPFFQWSPAAFKADSQTRKKQTLPEIALGELGGANSPLMLQRRAIWDQVVGKEHWVEVVRWSRRPDRSEGDSPWVEVRFQDGTLRKVPFGVWSELPTLSEPLSLQFRLVSVEGASRMAVEFTASPSPVPCQLPPRLPAVPLRGSWWDALRSLRYLGPDLLVSTYGGEGEKASVLALPQPCSLKKGDCLVWRDEWHSLSPGEKTEGLPLAQLVGETPQELQFLVWDETGEQEGYWTVPLRRASAPSLASPLEELRVRLSQKLGARLGRYRVLLQEGDWWCKVGGLWTRLDRAEEIDQCVAQRFAGELLIIDSVRSEGQTLAIRGQLFDATHTQMQSIHHVVSLEKKAPVEAKSPPTPQPTARQKKNT